MLDMLLQTNYKLKLLVNAGVRDSKLFEMLRQVVNNSYCKTCALYKASSWASTGTDFNQAVAVDLCLHGISKK